MTILSVLATNGLLIYQTWVAIAPRGGIRSVNLGKGSLLHVFFRNGEPYSTIYYAQSSLITGLEILYFV